MINKYKQINLNKQYIIKINITNFNREIKPINNITSL